MGIKHLAGATMLVWAALAGAQEPAEPPAPAQTEAQPSQAIDPALTRPAQITLSADGRTLFVVGALGQGSFVRFAQLLRANPRVDTVFLASPGGLVLEGYLMGNAVRTRNLATRVDYVCSSACTAIFASGGQRVLGPRARIGFHQTYQMNQTGQASHARNYRNKDGALETTLEQGATFNIASTGDSTTVRALRRAGVSDAFIARVLHTPPGEMWFPEASELLREGMVTRLAEAALPAQLPAGARPLEDVTADLLGKDLWRSLAQHRPAQFDQTALSVWRDTNSGVSADEAEWSARAPVERALFPDIASANDDLAGRFLAFFAADARFQRDLGYPQCTGPRDQVGAQPVAAPDDPRGQAITQPDPVVAELRETGARLNAELMAAQAPVRAPNLAQARRKLQQQARRMAETGLVYQDQPDGSDGFYCREAYRAYEAMARLAPRQQLETFRAFIVVSAQPDAAGE